MVDYATFLELITVVISQVALVKLAMWAHIVTIVHVIISYGEEQMLTLIKVWVSNVVSHFHIHFYK